MIVERHYDDEALISILQGDGSGDARDPHLTACSTCAETLESYRAVADVLGEAAVWDSRELREEPAAETITRLRAFARTREAETDIAAVLVGELFRHSRESWCSAVANDIRYHNAGVASALISSSETAIDTNPKDAVEMARAALTVANVLIDEDGERDVVPRVRGAAGRQYAYTLFYTGENREALVILEAAQRELERCAIADYDIARLNIVRALVYRSLEKFQDAIELSREAARTFEKYGDRQRVSSARMTEAYLLMHQSRYAEALPILRSVERASMSEFDATTRAMTLANIAICQSNTGQQAEAMSTYKVSAALFEEIGIRTESVRVRASIAVILRSEGYIVEAKRRLMELRNEVRELGMRYLAATLDLEVADFLLVEGKFESATTLCMDALEYFKSSGSTETEGPLIALTFLREAAEQRRLSREVVSHVKRYIEKAEKQPRLLFAPLPVPRSDRFFSIEG